MQYREQGRCTDIVRRHAYSCNYTSFYGYWNNYWGAGPAYSGYFWPNNSVRNCIGKLQKNRSRHFHLLWKMPDSLYLQRLPWYLTLSKASFFGQVCQWLSRRIHWGRQQLCSLRILPLKLFQLRQQSQFNTMFILFFRFGRFKLWHIFRPSTMRSYQHKQRSTFDRNW